MPAHRPAREDLVQRLAPPGEADLGQQRSRRSAAGAGQFVVEEIERGEVGAGDRVGDEAAGEPAIRVDLAQLGLERGLPVARRRRFR
jgi:hypothetical protein